MLTVLLFLTCVLHCERPLNEKLVIQLWQEYDLYELTVVGYKRRQSSLGGLKQQFDWLTEC